MPDLVLEDVVINSGLSMTLNDPPVLGTEACWSSATCPLRLSTLSRHGLTSRMITSQTTRSTSFGASSFIPPDLHGRSASKPTDRLALGLGRPLLPPTFVGTDRLGLGGLVDRKPDADYRPTDRGRTLIQRIRCCIREES